MKSACLRSDLPDYKIIPYGEWSKWIQTFSEHDFAKSHGGLEVIKILKSGIYKLVGVPLAIDDHAQSLIKGETLYVFKDTPYNVIKVS